MRAEAANARFPAVAATSRFRSAVTRGQAQIVGLSGMVGFLILWEAIGQLRLIDPYFTSYPSLIAGEVWRQYAVSGDIYRHISISLQEFAVGYAAAALVGIPLGVAMGRFRNLNYLANPFVDAIYATPIVILLPLFIIWLGIGLWSKVVMIFAGAFFPIVINTFEGVRGTDPTYIEAARSYGAKERDIFFKVVMVAAIPFIVAGLRLAIGRALIMTVVAEMFSGSQGMGYMVSFYGQMFQTTKLFVYALTIACLGVVLNNLLRLLQRRAAPWLHERQEQ